MATDTPRLLLSKPDSTDLVSAFQASVSSDFDDIDTAFLIAKGAWTTSTAYDINDIVTDANIAYRCTAAHTSSGANQPPNVSFWEQWANTGGGTPATTVTSETTLGISSAVGTDTEYARQDHTHGSPSRAAPGFTLGTSNAAGSGNGVIVSDASIAIFDATAPTTSAVGDAAAVGSVAFAARRDHVHGREAFATNAVILGTAAAAGVATTLIRSDATIAAFDATVPTTIQPDDSAATGSVAFAARRDHKHAIVADVAGASAVGDSAAEGSSTSFARADHRHSREAFATNAVVLGTAAAAGSATTLIRSDATIAAFDATVPTTSAPGDAAATGSVAFAARRDHVHGRESATRFIRFDMYGGFAPDDGTGEKAARPFKIKSSGAVITNSPTVYGSLLAMEASTDQHWLYQFILPSNYSSGGTLRGKFSGATATTGNVVMKASIAPITDSSTDTDSVQWNTVTVSSATTVAGTVGQVVEFTIALTTTGMSANRLCYLFIGRDADNGSDTMTGDAYLHGLNLEYTGSS